MSRRRAVVLTQQIRQIMGPQGPVGQQNTELTKVVDIDTPLEDVWAYVSSKGTNRAIIIFESEEPDIPLKAVKSGN